MRVLFDKNVPYQVRRYLLNHNVRTAAEQGWGRLTNGELLKAAEAEKFDVMVTADQNLSYQQNLNDRPLALVVLGTNKFALLEAEPERLVRAVDGATAGSYQFVEYKLPPKPGARGRGSDLGLRSDLPDPEPIRDTDASGTRFTVLPRGPVPRLSPRRSRPAPNFFGKTEHEGGRVVVLRCPGSILAGASQQYVLMYIQYCTG